MQDIKLDKTNNVRDLGGTKANNKTIKMNKLIRSKSLDKLTKKDIEKLVKECKLKTIIDLRTEREVIERPDVVIPNVNNINISIFTEKVPGITHDNESEKEGIRDAKKIDMASMYREVLMGEYLERVRKIIKTIINLQDEEYSVIYHCTAGKDRTGIITAILLLILGVDKETIIKDYMYTNIFKQKKDKFYLWLLKNIKRDKEKFENLNNLFYARQEYLEAVFNVIYEEYNGLDDFIINGLELTNEEIKSFKEKVLE